jgi:hypothetical protein
MKPGISRVARCASLAGALLVVALTTPANAAPQYHIAHEVKLPAIGSSSPAAPRCW